MENTGYECPITNANEEKTAEHYVTYLEARRDKEDEDSDAWWNLHIEVGDLTWDLEYYRANIKPTAPAIALVIDNSHDHMFQLRNPEHKAPTLTLVK